MWQPKKQHWVYQLSERNVLSEEILKNVVAKISGAGFMIQCVIDYIYKNIFSKSLFSLEPLHNNRRALRT